MESKIQHFDSDYMEGAHPKILQRILETNMDKLPGYGVDQYCQSAKEKIRKACECPEAQVEFLVGGTQTNATIIDALLQPYQGVICAETGHINVHEAGAVEANGHKVIGLPQANGKISASQVDRYLENLRSDESYEHMVDPGMVYISHPTEVGTLYTKKELEELRQVCDKYGIYLYMDGARLGYGLMAYDTDVTLPDVARLCDAFYIGGTKVGALFGEAVVFTRPDMVKHFLRTKKQHGALLAKGWLLGLQFDTLFTDNLYFEISHHAIDVAMKLKKGLLEKGYRLYMDSPTNQQFVIMENEKLREFSKKVTYTTWERIDGGHTAIRLAISWATREEDIEELIDML